MGLHFIQWMKLMKQKIVMKMDETQQCKWDRELKVNDISEGYISHWCCCAYDMSKIVQNCVSILQITRIPTLQCTHA
jgi:hypothetical protein